MSYQKEKYTVWIDKASITTRHGRNVEIIRLEIFLSMIDRALMDKVDSTQVQMGNVSQEMKILRKNQK